MEARKARKKIKTHKVPKKMEARKARKKRKAYKEKRHEGTQGLKTREDVKRVGT